MGSATASGPNRAEEAAKLAVSSPLLEGSDLTGARGLLVYVTASNSLKLSEPRKVMKVLSDFVSKGANVIFGSARDDSLGDELRVTVVATGMDSPLTEQEKAQTGMRRTICGPAFSRVPRHRLTSLRSPLSLRLRLPPLPRPAHRNP